MALKQEYTYNFAIITEKNGRTIKIARHEIAGHENYGPNCRA